MAHKRKVRPATYGLMAEFDNPSDAVAAARRVHEEGYKRVDAFSPYPVEELSEAIGVHKTHMPLIILIGRRFPIERPAWARNLLIHIPIALFFSALHVAGCIFLTIMMRPFDV